MKREDYDQLTATIIGAAIEVHRELGPGLLESVYEECLMEELRLRGLKAKRQVELPIFYKGKKLKKFFVIDILVEGKVIIELKCVEVILPVHEVQLVTYLKLADKRVGYLMNFNVAQLIKGLRRKVNKF